MVATTESDFGSITVNLPGRATEATMAKSAKASRPSTGKMRCAIYTRKSSEEGLEQAFNSLDAQREACAAFILSQNYLHDLKLRRVEAAAGELDEMRKGARLGRGWQSEV